MVGITFEVNEDVFVKVIGLPATGRKRKKQSIVFDVESLFHFFLGKATLVKMHKGYERANFLESWD